MHFLAFVALAIASTGVLAADAGALEPADFNITEALLEQGIDVSEIPALESFNTTSAIERRATNSACSIAVSCAAACASLKFLYGSAAVYSRGESTYDTFTGGYWSDAQQAVSPSCVFKPSKATDVSVVVLLARLTQCPFAAKSGGHAAMAGASSIEGGITISFANMNGVSLSKDKKVVSLGPGNIWGPVFENLAKSDLTVVGGRLYNIGVGGLTTGGGISYFSNLYGWACDNVDSFEVVTASGIMVKASATENSDLFWALRGGGNNFGLVTSFNLKTIPLPGGQIWGGQKMYLEDSFLDLDKAFFHATQQFGIDTKAGSYLVYVYTGGMKLGLPVLYHADAINGGSSPAWDGYKNMTALSDTTKTRVLHEWAAETMNDSPNGLRQIFYSFTFKANVEMAAFARQYFFDTVEQIADVPGIVPNIVYQGTGTNQLSQMNKNGGNPTGLGSVKEPLYIALIAASWYNEEDDARVHKHISDVMKVLKAESVARGVASDFVYMNYASQYQDVVKTYGATNKAKLQSIAKKYDPAQVFQTLEPGYFKLNRGPVNDPSFFNV